MRSTWACPECIIALLRVPCLLDTAQQDGGRCLCFCLCLQYQNYFCSVLIVLLVSSLPLCLCLTVLLSIIPKSFVLFSHELHIHEGKLFERDRSIFASTLQRDGQNILIVFFNNLFLSKITTFGHFYHFFMSYMVSLYKKIALLHFKT